MPSGAVGTKTAFGLEFSGFDSRCSQHQLTNDSFQNVQNDGDGRRIGATDCRVKKRAEGGSFGVG